MYRGGRRNYRPRRNYNYNRPRRNYNYNRRRRRGRGYY